MFYGILSLYYSIMHNWHVLNIVTNVKEVNIFVKGNNSSRYIDICQFFF